jgi:hypothetical protein
MQSRLDFALLARLGEDRCPRCEPCPDYWLKRDGIALGGIQRLE